VVPGTGLRVPVSEDGEAGGCRLVHHSIGRSGRFFGDQTALNTYTAPERGA